MLYIIPTRGRPLNMERQMKAWHLTFGHKATALYVIDPDDPYHAEYRTRFGELGLTHASLMTLPERMRLGPTLNFLAPDLAGSEEHIGFMGDDHLPKTINWDVFLEAELHRMKWGVVYGNDLIQGVNLPTAMVMTSNIISTLGYMVPPGLTHLFLDNFWLEMGRNTNLRYRGDIIIQHMHPAGQTAEWDARYEEVNSPAQWGADTPVWDRYKTGQIFDDVRKLRAAMIGVQS